MRERERETAIKGGMTKLRRKQFQICKSNVSLISQINLINDEFRYIQISIVNKKI